jgi:hypothetical protein
MAHGIIVTSFNAPSSVLRLVQIRLNTLRHKVALDDLPVIVVEIAIHVLVRIYQNRKVPLL